MDALIHDLAQVLAQTAWFFAVKYKMYDFRQMDGQVIRVTVGSFVPETMEIDMPVYAETVS